VEVTLRGLEAGDLDTLSGLLERTGVFRPEEIGVAREVLEAALKPGQADYSVRVAECGGEVVGYAAWGETPCTRGTFDLYWIATHPSCQGKGVGRRLMEEAERDMRERGGRLCLIETSSLPQYEPTRRFYLGLGYEEAAVLKDFYMPGDHKVIYMGRL
jgi:ribosomal protein S18 acetylase RimI-like enzyme